MKTVDVRVKGARPIMICRFSEDREVQSEANVTKKDPRKIDPRAVAELGVYRDGDGRLVFPATWIIFSMAKVGSGYKIKGARRTYKMIIPVGVRVTEEHVLFSDPEGKALMHFEVDSRSVPNRTCGRVMNHRAKLQQWCASFSLEIDETVADVDACHKILADVGRYNGWGVFRPYYGLFEVVEWSERFPEKVLQPGEIVERVPELTVREGNGSPSKRSRTLSK